MSQTVQTSSGNGQAEAPGDQAGPAGDQAGPAKEGAVGTPPGRALMEMVRGSSRAQLVAAFARLGLADLLAGGRRSGDELAEELSADPETLGSFLRACGVTGLLAETDGRFGLTPLSELLRSGPSSLLSVAIAFTAPCLTRPGEGITGAVMTGIPSTESVLGVSLWEYYKTHPDEWQHYARSMTMIAEDCARALPQNFDFTPYARIADIGGGQGGLLSRILASAPESTGVLFDLGEMMDRARELFGERGLTSRVELVAGNFLEAIEPGASLYVMKSVLCDWDDPHVARILANIHAAAPSGGTLLIVDWTLSSQPQLAVTDFGLRLTSGGRIRTRSHFQKLIEEAGFEFEGVTTFSSELNVWSMLQARRP